MSRQRPARANLVIRAAVDAGLEHRIVSLRDLSLHGAGVEGELPHASAGDEVTVRFTLPGNRVVEARAEVRNHRRSGRVGLRFLRLPHEASQAIHAFLEAGGAASTEIDPARAA